MDIHGGNLDFIEEHFNINKNDIIDFSDNINPLGAPPIIKKRMDELYSLLNVYPDENYKKLKTAIASYTNTLADNILVGNGATELISALIHSLKPKKSLIILPTYSEYEKELIKENSLINYFEVTENDDFKLNTKKLLEHLTPDIELLIFCNPNNPTGYATPTSELEEILVHCEKNNTVVLLDETYVEFSKNNKGATPLVEKYTNLFIIRGTSKFFAISGLRLGYAICSNEDILNRVSGLLIKWNVNVVAEFLGQLIFTDTAFINKSIELRNNEYEKFRNYFNKIDKIKMFESDTNFILFKILSDDIDLEKLFIYMLENNILIRNLTFSKGLSSKYFRICIQKPEDNDKFLNCLSNFM